MFLLLIRTRVKDGTSGRRQADVRGKGASLYQVSLLTARHWSKTHKLLLCTVFIMIFRYESG